MFAPQRTATECPRDRARLGGVGRSGQQERDLGGERRERNEEGRDGRKEDEEGRGEDVDGGDGTKRDEMKRVERERERERWAERLEGGPSGRRRWRRGQTWRGCFFALSPRYLSRDPVIDLTRPAARGSTEHAAQLQRSLSTPSLLPELHRLSATQLVSLLPDTLTPFFPCQTPRPTLRAACPPSPAVLKFSPDLRRLPAPGDSTCCLFGSSAIRFPRSRLPRCGASAGIIGKPPLAAS